MSVQPDPTLDRRAVPATSTALLPRVEALMDALAGAREGTAAEMVREHLSTGGKRLRARLALDAASCLGVPDRWAVPLAAACELLHNASLVHDDVQDGDRIRRGRPALWTRWGAPQAINAGDLLLMLPTLALEHLEAAGAPPERLWQVSRCIAVSGAYTARGQADEMRLRGDVLMDREAYMAAAKGKTAGLFGMPVEGAALLAGRGLEEARTLARPFETLGLLYQLMDDVVDLYGDKGRDRPGADIREGKVSALTVAHVELHPEDRLWLTGVLRTPRDETSDATVEEVIVRFAEEGALETVLGWIDAETAAVRSTLDPELPALSRVAEGLLQRILTPLKAVSP